MLDPRARVWLPTPWMMPSFAMASMYPADQSAASLPSTKPLRSGWAVGRMPRARAKSTVARSRFMGSSALQLVPSPWRIPAAVSWRM